MTEKGKQFVWNEACQEAFNTLKGHLTSVPVLAHPNILKKFILETDASNDSIRAVLFQIDKEGKEVVIVYASRSLSKAEKRYCVTRKDLLAVVSFVKYYLYGRKFKVRTDYGSLRWLMRFKKPGQLTRWLEVLSEFDIEIVHRPGVQHRNADALSRIPCKQCGFYSSWEDKTESRLSEVNSCTGQTDEDDIETTETLKQIQDNDPTFEEISGKGFVIRSLLAQIER